MSIYLFCYHYRGSICLVFQIRPTYFLSLFHMDVPFPPQGISRILDFFLFIDFLLIASIHHSLPPAIILQTIFSPKSWFTFPWSLIPSPPFFLFLVTSSQFTRLNFLPCVLPPYQRNFLISKLKDLMTAFGSTKIAHEKIGYEERIDFIKTTLSAKLSQELLHSWILFFVFWIRGLQTAI